MKHLNLFVFLSACVGIGTSFWMAQDIEMLKLFGYITTGVLALAMYALWEVTK